MKKIFYIFMMVFTALTLVACTEDVVIEILVNKSTVSLNEGDTEKLVVTTNDEAGYTVSVEDSSIASISEDLTVSAVAHSATKIIFTAKSDETKKAEVTVTVLKIVNVDLSAPEGVLWVGMSFDLTYVANDELTFESSNTNVATVSAAGFVELVGAGSVTITATSKLDTTVFDSITLNVLDLAQGIAIEGVDKGNVGTKRTLSVVAAPENAVVEVSYASSDESLATVNQSGEVTFLKPGVVTISAVYAYDESLVATKEIEIVDIAVVDQSK